MTVFGGFELDGKVVDLLVELNVEEVVVDVFTVEELFGDLVNGTFGEVSMVDLTLADTVLGFVEGIVSENGSVKSVDDTCDNVVSMVDLTLGDMVLCFVDGIVSVKGSVNSDVE